MQAPATFAQQRALIKGRERHIKARAWFLSHRGLPPSIEIEDLIQVGYMAVTKYFEKCGWTEQEGASTYLEKAIDGAMIEEINMARTGTRRPVDTPFSMVSFSSLGGDGEDEFDILASSDVEQFSFAAAPVTPPTDPESRLRVYQAASEMLVREYKAATRFESVRGIYETEKGEWELRFRLMGRECGIGGFETRKKAARYKFDLLTWIRDAVLPIDPSGKIEIAKPRNKFERLSWKSARLPDAPAKRTSAVLGRPTMAQFMYDNPLNAMLILEQMCIKGLDDWTALNDIVPGAA